MANLYVYQSPEKVMLTSSHTASPPQTIFNTNQTIFNTKHDYSSSNNGNSLLVRSSPLASEKVTEADLMSAINPDLLASFYASNENLLYNDDVNDPAANEQQPMSHESIMNLLQPLGDMFWGPSSS